uniref:Uncharacterized protein n=1 Tax=Tanacetum cinerariifolium TaxID=118510 RepID=A0A6L2NH04_TANCI|nr:hypothetical protein [Tanacetum cinerariifolium]
MEIGPEDDDEVKIKATPLSSKSPTIVDYKIYKEGKESYFKIIKADRNSQTYLTFGTMFKNFNREDLEVLRSIVKTSFEKTKPVNDMDNLLSQTLKTMFEHQNMLYYLLVEKMYLFTKNILHQMWNGVKLQVDYVVEMDYDLLRLIRRQINEGYIYMHEVFGRSKSQEGPESGLIDGKTLVISTLYYTRSDSITFNRSSMISCIVTMILANNFRVPPYLFNYHTRRLNMEEILAKFIDKGKHKYEEMEISIKDNRTTDDLLSKEQSNLLSELKIKVNKLSKVLGNVLIPKNEVKGVTTRGGKMTSEAAPGKEINETRINKNELPIFEQDM